MDRVAHRRPGATLLSAVAVLLAGTLAGCTATASPGGGPDPAGGSPPGGTEESGYLAEPISPFADDWAITGLEPGLRAALHAAAEDAAADGVELVVTSGRRSAGYQQELLDHAIREYGSEEEARRWVSTPELSRHVTGEAVDIGYTDGADWMVRNGARYGLCQTYANEMWHFERVVAPGEVCPAARPDASAG
ncbi:M15 family metallopeptidase [Streptomyces xiamenensis]|uniref:M15 family metallopeptidase n=1 Tax=Streptomyces xiamenensis TaxID=408015 RepID=UPI0036DFA968